MSHEAVVPKNIRSERFRLYLDDGVLMLKDSVTYMTYDWDECGRIVQLMNQVNRGFGMDKKIIREMYEELEELG